MVKQNQARLLSGFDDKGDQHENLLQLWDSKSKHSAFLRAMCSAAPTDRIARLPTLRRDECFGGALLRELRRAACAQHQRGTYWLVDSKCGAPIALCHCP